VIIWYSRRNIKRGEERGDRKRRQISPEEEIARIRVPKEGEMLGLVELMLGSDKLRVQCDDGKERIVRIPGKLRKRVWIRVGDIILIQPWKVMSDRRADVVWRYTKTQAKWLERKGYMKNISVG
jgi:translation initiation factor 1A